MTFNSAHFILKLVNILILQAVFLFCSFHFANAQNPEVFLKLEKGDPYVSVYNKAGVNWKYCELNQKGECSEGIGWLDQDSKVWVAGPKVKATTKDPFTNQIVEEEYYPVQFAYKRMGKDEEGNDKLIEHVQGPIGYIDAAYVDFEQRAPLFSLPKEAQKTGALICPGKKAYLPQLEELTGALVLKSIEETASLLKDRIGFCVNLDADTDKKANLYDNVILKKLNRISPPKLKGENDQYITQEQLIDVDALARTLYGEMASCYKHGLHYPMAVARIALNRSEDGGRHPSFVQGRHLSEKPRLSRVVTTPSQFSIWLRKLNKKENPPLGMAMCPPREKTQKLWNGKKPSAQELAIWNHTVKIATEAVLFPNSFKKRTQELNQRFFYTSGMGQFYKMKKDHVKIEGRAVDKAQCMEIWNHK